MPRNTHFQFKQFLINQDMCGMKVCTDSCIFGAYVEVKASQRILDIGTGTGLLALMAAQRSDALIDAVEIEANAAEQAKNNFEGSPWNDRISLIQADIKQLSTGLDAQYDTIICNPPFFSNNLKSEDAKKNLAMHGEQMEFRDLVDVAGLLLADSGKLWVLLPEFESGVLNDLARKAGFHLNHRLLIRERRHEKVIRIISVFGKEKLDFTESRLTIRTEAGEYSPEFSSMLQDYYLNL